MKTFGLLPSQTLASIQVSDGETPAHLIAVVGQDRLRLDTVCLPRRFWETHPAAPWNVIIERNPEVWRENYPDAWGDVADDDPVAPWNVPEPDRNPGNYTIDEPDGTTSPMLWPMPTIVPLAKIEKPADTPTHTSTPILVWFDDRVERQWQAVPIPPDELAARARKIWTDAAAFLAEFSMTELAAIELSTDATIAALRLLLASWPKDVWSDDPRIVMGLAALVSAGIIDETRSAEITAK
jgi:hypothetical protein